MTDVTEGLKAVRFYLSLPDPLPKAGAVSLVSVFHRESRLKPGSQGNQASERGGVLNLTGAFGIASWNGPRQQALKDFCDRHVPALAYDALESQLLFVLNEMANSYPKSWAVIRDTTLRFEQIIPVIVREYENPKEPDPEIRDAIAYAIELWPHLEESAVMRPTIVPPVIATTPPVGWSPPPATVVSIAPSTGGDSELHLLESLVASLQALAPDARKRVLTYLYSRMVP